MAKKDLTGQVFGRLTVLEDVGRNKHRRVIWRCLCSCGNIVDVRSSDLQRGHTQSCGCLRKETTSQRSYLDLTGRVFGRLTVLEDVGRDKYKTVVWKCQCECGNTVNVISGNLQHDVTHSCGCYMRDRITETHAGEKSHLWRGGITPLRKAIRSCTKYTNWRTAIFQRDNYTCIYCNTRGNIIGHHIKFFSTLLKEFHITTLEEAEACEAFWDVNNGITLCTKCHKKEHRRLKGLTTSPSSVMFNPDFDIDK